MTTRTKKISKNQTGGYAVGIDLGTTYSVVGCFRNNAVEIFDNDSGNRTTPSVVSFMPKETLVGESAKDNAAMFPENTIFAAKRFIGRRFGSESVTKDAKAFPFKVVKSEEGDCPSFELPEDVAVDGKPRIVDPVTVSSLILTKLKTLSEKKLGGPADKAVITVPAYFNDEQRAETKRAGEIAGFEVLGILNEPTAAAIAYGLSKVDEKSGETSVSGNILVFDLGGGTFDITVLEVNNGVFNVLSTEGDTHLGGEDFDNSLRSHVERELAKRYKITGFSEILHQKPRSLSRLQTACEKSKRTLSDSSTAKILVENLLVIKDKSTPVDVNLEITRAKFEFLCEPLFKRIETTIDNALEAADRKANNIDHVVVVGGSSRIPRIRQMLDQKFPGKTVKYDVHPDEAIGYGAALQAGILSGAVSESENNAAKGIMLVDVAPLSIGVKVAGDQVEKIIKRNTPIPTSHTMSFTTTSDNQSLVEVEIYEGERPSIKDNNKLGLLILDGIFSAPKGIPRIDVSLEINVNGILGVKVTDHSTGKTVKKTIKREGGRANEEYTKKLIAEADAYRFEDENNIKRHNVLQKFDNYIANVRNSLEKYNRNMTDTEEGHLSALERKRRKIAQEIEYLLIDIEEYLDISAPNDETSAIETEYEDFEIACNESLARFHADPRELEEEVLEEEMEEREKICQEAVVSFDSVKPKTLKN